MTAPTQHPHGATPDGADAGSESAKVELLLDGMTCASCATRIEKKLNRLDGVDATVNFALERAAVRFDPDRISTADLVAAVEAAGYGARVPEPRGHGDGADGGDHAAENLEALRRRLIVAVVATVPVVLFAMVPATQFDGWQWLSFVLASVVVFWSGFGFHKAMWATLRQGSAGMDTLISIGSLAAWGWSVVAIVFLGAGALSMRMRMGLTFTASGEPELYFEVAASVITLILLGRFLEARAKRRAGAALEALLELGAKDVARLDADGVETRIPVDELVVGDRFVVRPGEKVATDGVVEEGTSAVDASLLTGESVPVDVGPGDRVTGATQNTTGRLVVRATRVGAETALAQIGRLVSDAQSGKAEVQRLADRVSAVFVPIVIVLACATLGFWLGAGAPAQFAFTAAVAVLIIACPCALGLATPTALLVGTGRGAQLGILIKGPEMLESTRRIDTIVLDKTGTVTSGKMSVVDVTFADGADAASQQRWRWAIGAAEAASEHPIAQAVAVWAGDGLDAGVAGLAAPSAFVNRAGMGVVATVDGQVVVVGRPELCADEGAPLDAVLVAAVGAGRAAGRTTIVAAVDGVAVAVIAVADTVKPTSAAAIAALRSLGLTPVLLTGDHLATARTVAAEVGIDDVRADVLPDQKAAVVRGLQAQGRVVAMVGDGVNDAPALAAADLGLAIGTGTDVAIEASDLTLVSGDVRAAADAIRLSRRTLATIKGNLFWAFAYNAAAIPVAAAGLLNPIVASAAMAFSSVFVVTNSLRLRRFNPTHPD